MVVIGNIVWFYMMITQLVLHEEKRILLKIDIWIKQKKKRTLIAFDFSQSLDYIISRKRVRKEDKRQTVHFYSCYLFEKDKSTPSNESVNKVINNWKTKE